MLHEIDYRCPGCVQPVSLHARIGGWVIPHFKHKAQSSCQYGRGETDAHRSVKNLLRDHYSAKGHEVELEFDKFDAIDRRADVFVKEPIKSAFEVEFSQKEADEFLRKCHDYHTEKIRSLWILRQKADYASVETGEKVVITTSPVLYAYFSKKPRGAGIAFFSYVRRVPVVVRGTLSSFMLYKESFGDYGGHEYVSRRHMILRVEEIIR